jgi:hypothetical protein
VGKQLVFEAEETGARDPQCAFQLVDADDTKKVLAKASLVADVVASRESWVKLAINIDGSKLSVGQRVRFQAVDGSDSASLAFDDVKMTPETEPPGSENSATTDGNMPAPVPAQ